MASGGSDSQQTYTYTTDEALSQLRFGRFQALVLGFLGIGWIAEAMEIMLLSFIGPSVKEEWGLSGGEEGLVTSVLFVGTLAGACAGGLASDRYGRRVSVLFTALVTGISGFLCAFSPNYMSLLALRFVVGLGLGASHVLPTWFLEFIPAESRGSWMAVFACFWTVGTILVALLAWGIMPILGWRWLLALSSLPCFILLFFIGLIPESPRYLCSRGKASDAMIVLERIAVMNNRALPSGILTRDSKRRVDNNLDASVTTPLILSEVRLGIDKDMMTKSNGITMFNAFLAVWSSDLIRSTLLLWLIYFTLSFSYYGIVLITADLSNGLKIRVPVRSHPMQSSTLYINVLVTNFAEFPGFLLAALLVDRVGRRVSLGGMLLLCCASLAPLAAQLGESLAVPLLFCARASIEGSFAILHVYSPEIYPTSCRSTGVGLGSSIGRVGSIVASLVIITLLDNSLQKEAVFMIVPALIIAGIACAFFPLETKGREME